MRSNEYYAYYTTSNHAVKEGFNSRLRPVGDFSNSFAHVIYRAFLHLKIMIGGIYIMFTVKSSILQESTKQIWKSLKDVSTANVLIDSLVYIKNIGSDFVSLYYSSNELSAEKRIPAIVSEEFSFATSIKEFVKMVSALPIDVETKIKHVKNKEAQKIELSWGDRRKNQLLIDSVSGETDNLIIPETSKTINVDDGFLRTVLRFKDLTAEVDPEKFNDFPVISGIQLSSSNTGKLIIRATNRHSSATLISDYDWSFKNDIVIDAAALQAVSKLMSCETKIRIGINENSSRVFFHSEQTTVITGVLVGLFPSIDHIYSHKDKAQCKFIFDRSELMDLCTRVMKVCDTGSKLVKFECEDNSVFAVVPNVLKQQLGAAIEGEQCSFALSSSELFKSIKMYETCDEVLCWIADPSNTPIVITSEDAPNQRVATAVYRIQGANSINIKERKKVVS